MSISNLDIKSLPNPKHEEWKYTNIARALGDLKDIIPETPDERLIHKSRGKACGKVDEVLWNGADGKHHSLRLKIVLEDGAQATIIERHRGEGSYWKNMSTQIILGKNSRLNHIRIQEDSADAVQTNMVHIAMDRDAYLNSFTINLGGKMTRNDISVVLNDTGIDCNLSGVNLVKGKQHCDTTILMEYTAPHCRSNQFYRTILDDNARGVFQGKLLVHKDAQKTYGQMISNALMLSDKCEMDVKPELEIYADDVKCSHGSTIGQLDEDPLFYLRTRGLNEAQARELLIQAFIDEVIEKITDEGICAEIKAKATGWLSCALKSYE